MAIDLRTHRDSNEREREMSNVQEVQATIVVAQFTRIRSIGAKFHIAISQCELSKLQHKQNNVIGEKFYKACDAMTSRDVSFLRKQNICLGATTSTVEPGRCS